MGRIFSCLFATPFAGAGLFALWNGIKKFSAGDVGQGMGIAAFGLVFSAVGFGLMYWAITAGRRQRLADEKWNAQTDGGKKVWLARGDWAAGRIKSGVGAQQKVFLIMGVGFCLIGGGASSVALPQELPKGNHLVLLVLLFPVIGIIFLGGFVRGLLAQRRFGDCWFELAQIPAPLGGSLDGLIQTEKPIRLEQGLHLKISCIQRRESGAGEDRTTIENILWQNEKVFRPDAALVSAGAVAGGSAIPVHFDLPGDQPEASLRGNPTVVWRLEARAKMAGPDFTAVFDVPVFRVAGFVPPPRPEADPTAPMQMSGEEIRRDERSRITVKRVDSATEFYFPAARNVGMAVVITLVFPVWSGFIWLMITKHAPILFSIVFGIFDALILWGLLHAWFKSTRVTVNATIVRLETNWMVFKTTREFSAGDYARFATKMGMQSGSTFFTDIKLVRAGAESEYAENQKKIRAAEQSTEQRPTRELVAAQFRNASGPRGVTVASNIASAGEAEWLVRELNRAYGRL
jgi:hypothetical protein